MTVGFHSPLPPARTGVADYAASLLRALGRRGRVETGAARADVHLYHIGNNPVHAAIYAQALDRPGVVVLHDALVQHLLLSTLDERRYVEEFVYNYGAWSAELARDLWRSRSGSGLREEYYQYPLLKRLIERSRAVVVHNAAAARIARGHAPGTRVVEIPHLLEIPPRSTGAEAIRFRQRIGIAPGAFVFGLFGYLRESKRVATVLRAAERVPQATLLLAGEFASLDLPRAIAPRLDGVVRLGHMNDETFWLAGSAVDACVNLRYPRAGETSGITIRLMGLGKPVIVTAGEEVDAFPEDACLRVDAGVAEEEMLAGYMLWLSNSADAAREIGRRAAGYVTGVHSLERVAALYWETLCACR
ncbi:MAG: hypothetical protein ACRD96_26080 [Bryobacteraceae bacterium]